MGALLFAVFYAALDGLGVWFDKLTMTRAHHDEGLTMTRGSP
jgi:hypothetical protein